jgi:hypothetical protein
MVTRVAALVSFAPLMLAVASAITVGVSAEDPNATFQGVWRTLEVTVSGPSGRTFKPEATLAIFHGRHYSRIELHAEQSRLLNTSI